MPENSSSMHFSVDRTYMPIIGDYLMPGSRVVRTARHHPYRGLFSIIVLMCILLAEVGTNITRSYWALRELPLTNPS